jgi:hypothetical protein
MERNPTNRALLAAADRGLGTAHAS